MTTWTLIKSFSVCLICTIIAHVTASWSARHMLDQQMHHAIIALEAHGWHMAHNPAIQKQTRLFGAALTYRDIDMIDDARHHFSARALTVTHHLFLRPRLDFSTVIARRDEGDVVTASSVHLKLNRLGRWTGFRVTDLSIVSRSEPAFSVAAPHLDGDVLIQPPDAQKLLSVALSARSNRLTSSPTFGTDNAASFPLLSMTLTDAQIKAALDLKREAASGTLHLSRAYIQQVAGHVGPLAMLLSGKIDGQGDGELTTEMWNIKSAIEGWRSAHQSPLEDAARARLLDLLEKMDGDVPDHVIFSLRVQHWQIEPAAHGQLRTLFDALTFSSPS
ncbi:DUF2125 domain-containing protein [Candidatus Kirkpatrickella diaphorinae]|uniref:DUF2125 domain-containing protein n=1 Tax=Candidatus Kirkpatrickella diaphorinae TaxID=2984322 RepID=A0ABY6GJR2_9PROT|nr:hypothetical protein [Candidatus Kirkpatrickella diaphorinae]UYH51564.1 DUF2125 domain-containing protein [Candidatus Kirkpatrickella diaphorinae]